MDQNELASMYLSLSPVLFRLVRQEISNRTVFFELLEVGEVIMGSTSYIKNGHSPPDIESRKVEIRSDLRSLAELNDESEMVQIYISQLELIGRFVLACWEPGFTPDADG